MVMFAPSLWVSVEVTSAPVVGVSAPVGVAAGWVVESGSGVDWANAAPGMAHKAATAVPETRIDLNDQSAMSKIPPNIRFLWGLSNKIETARHAFFSRMSRAGRIALQAELARADGLLVAGQFSAAIIASAESIAPVALTFPGTSLASAEKVRVRPLRAII
jgi:hypothetical protein